MGSSRRSVKRGDTSVSIRVVGQAGVADIARVSAKPRALREPLPPVADTTLDASRPGAIVPSDLARPRFVHSGRTRNTLTTRSRTNASASALYTGWQLRKRGHGNTHAPSVSVDGSGAASWALPTAPIVVPSAGSATSPDRSARAAEEYHQRIPTELTRLERSCYRSQTATVPEF